MYAGMNFLAAGSWQKPVGDVNGFVVSGNGLFTMTWISEGIVDITLLYPTGAENIACIVTQRGAPVDAFFSVTQTSAGTKRVTFLTGEEDPLNVSFDFIFVHMAQPTQGL